MLEVLVKFICFMIVYCTGIYVVKKIVSNRPGLTMQSYLYFFTLAVSTIFLYPIQYTPLYSIVIFMLNILTYKKVFNLTFQQAIIVCCLFMVVLAMADTIVTTTLRLFYTLEQIRTDYLISIMTNLAIGIMSIEIIDTKFILEKTKKFYNNIKSKKMIANLVFLITLIIGIVYLIYNFSKYEIQTSHYIANIIILLVFVIIAYIFIQSKNSYNQLVDEYDTLFNYVQNFEEWIEKEQLNRHEYKNQLAVLRCLTTEKKVKKKIDEILEDNIEIEGEVVHRLKELPKGGFKGLMYYKAAIAQKKKIKLTVDVSLKRKTLLNKLTEEKIKTICKLVGIYFDNAIEAAQETKKKDVLLEIYELTDKVNIVISNTYNKSDNFDKRNERGVTTKGEGHGNGLYFANNLVAKNKWLSTKQEEIDNYYIQTITIKN